MRRHMATECDGPPVVGSPRFVGRGRELSVLRSALDSPPAVVLIEGEAGIGKSRLVREFLASPAGQRQRAIVASCPPFVQPHTLGPVTDALRQAIDDLTPLRLSPLAGALRPLFPEWASALPPAPEPAEDATAAQHRVFRALAELLDRCEVRLLTVDDGHWADEATLDFVLYLVSRQPNQISLIVTYRPEDVPAGSPLLRLASRVVAGATRLRLVLSPLDVAGTADLVSSMLGGQSLSAGFAAFVHEHTEGVPLAAEESVRLMGERHELTRRGGKWARRKPTDLDVPPTIRDAVLARVTRFSADVQAVLRAAAILAEPAPETAISAVSGLAPGRARAALSVGYDSGFLTENGRGLLSFRHMLTARAVYEAIPAPSRHEMHLRAGHALELSTPLPVAHLARHFREAGDTDSWCHYAEQAADGALATGDETTAATLLHDLVLSAGLPAGKVARLISKIPFGSITGDPRDLVRALRTALEARGLAPEEEADVRFQLGRVLTVVDQFEPASTELQRAIPHLAHDPAARARAMLILGWPRGTTWPLSAHRRWLRRAAEVMDPSIDEADRTELAVDRVSALLMLGEESGWAEAARISADASTPRGRNQETRACANLGDNATMWGRYADARRWLSRALEMAERYQYLRYRDGILGNLAHLDWFTGQWTGLADRAVSLAEKVPATHSEIQLASRLDPVLVLGLLHSAMGACAEAEERLQFVRDEMLRLRLLDYLMEPAAALARLRLADGRADDAVKITDEPISILVSKGIWVWATDVAPARVRALAAAGRVDEAAGLTEAFAHGLRGREAAAPKAALVLCQATLAEARGELARAAALFHRTAAAWQALPRPYDALLARERQASCLVALGQAEAGLGLAHQVYSGLTDLGARGDALRVMRTLRQLGSQVRRPGSGRPGYGDQLSPRELDVVRLLVGGRTNRDIAQELFLSPKTVARHVESARHKLGAASRTALAVRVVEEGILADLLGQMTNSPVG
jgi:DNA-binding CsgD family transcriptional regulator/tetratricopeptide (TPR) repeat protein